MPEHSDRKSTYRAQTSATASDMTANERTQLIRIVRLNYKVARASVDQRRVDLLADLEDQIVNRWKACDEAWKDAYDVVRQASDEANSRIREHFDQSDLPSHWAPHVRLEFQRHADRDGRRDELRRGAAARATADAHKAKLALDAAEAAMLSRLAAGGLKSEEARAFLGEVPQVGQLMPVLDLDQLLLMEGRHDGDVPF